MKTKKCNKICKKNIFFQSCKYKKKLIECDEYNTYYKEIDKINKELEKLFKNKFNYSSYTYKPVNKVEGGVSGALIFNILNKDGSINHKYIGKTLVERFILPNNIGFLFDNNFLNKYIKYVKKNKKSYLVKIYYIGPIKINGIFYDSMILENLQNIDMMENINSISKSNSMKNMVIDFKTTNVPFQNNTSILKTKKNLDILKIKLDKKQLLSDLNFLKKNSRVDYSSFLAINNNKFRYGIIDILQPFDVYKKTEKMYKNLLKSLNNDIIYSTSITNPDDYKKKYIDLLLLLNLL